MAFLNFAAPHEDNIIFKTYLPERLRLRSFSVK